MKPRTTGILLLVFAITAAVLRVLGLHAPLFKMPFLIGGVAGWLLCAVLMLAGLWLMVRGKASWNLTPITVKKLRRFQAIRRGYLSFLILLGLGGLASLDTLIVGKRALMVSMKAAGISPSSRRCFQRRLLVSMAMRRPITASCRPASGLKRRETGC